MSLTVYEFKRMSLLTAAENCKFILREGLSTLPCSDESPTRLGARPKAYKNTKTL